MKEYNFNSLTKYEKRDGKIYKTILIYLLFSAFFLYLFLTGGVKELIICGISIFMILLVMSARTASGKFAKGIVQTIKNTGNKKAFDVLPVKFSFSEKAFSATINKAEYYKKKVWNKTYSFVPENINALDYFDEDNTLIINYRSGKMICDAEGANKKEKELGKSFVIFYLTDEYKEKIIESLQKSGFTVNFISRVNEEKDKEENAEEENNAERITEENNAEIITEENK